MIQGIGIDSIEINRFNRWVYFTQRRLEKMFSQEEIRYCLENNTKSAERFAVRFAAREAFYKAFSHAFPTHTIPFLTICKALSINKLSNGVPYLYVDWQKLNVIQAPQSVHISFTHSKTMATAIIILS